MTAALPRRPYRKSLRESIGSWKPCTWAAQCHVNVGGYHSAITSRRGLSGFRSACKRSVPVLPGFGGVITVMAYQGIPEPVTEVCVRATELYSWVLSTANVILVRPLTPLRTPVL